MLSPAGFLALLSILLQATAAPVQPSSEYYQPMAVTSVLHPPTGFNGNARVESTLANARAIAVDHFASLSADVTISHSHSSESIHHVYTVQKYEGLEIVNAVSSLNFLPDGSAIVHNSLVPPSVLKKTVPLSKRSGKVIPVESAISSFAACQGYDFSEKLIVTQSGNEYEIAGSSFASAPIKASQKYYQTESKLLHVWDLQIQTDTIWVNVFVHSGTGRIVAKNNWMRDVSMDIPLTAHSAIRRKDGNASQEVNVERRAGAGTYNVVPIGSNDPSRGLAVVSSPADSSASPNGWHSSTYLSGNNVDATSAVQSTRPSSSSYSFTAPFDPSKDPADPNAATVGLTQMFYTANMAHDIFFNYGFTPVAGNFQRDGGDQVNAVTQQSGIGMDNNASFGSGPDGTPGRMNVGMFTSTNPRRDGALDNSVIVHEMAHGLSDRLTGGARDNNCLKGTEQNGLAEGWSDTVAFVLSTQPSATRSSNWMLAAWASNKANGIRDYPYSTSMSTNPYTYSNVWGFYTQGAHKIGQVWAAILYEVMWNMNDRSGITDPIKIVSSANSGYGNTDFLKLLVTGLKMQPCNPTFLQARDAIIAAEASLFGGKYRCDVWKGFAKRGMGAGAAGPQADSFTVPADACNGVVVTTTAKPSTTTTTTTTTKSAATTASPTSITTVTKTPATTATTTTITKPTTTTTTTTSKAATTTTTKVLTTTASGGSPDGTACTSFGASQCLNKVLYQCAYYNGQSLTWGKWGSC
ncbi:Fungalysin metallopeptidase-domain-containing protein [Obelidium mucronatum]|nr:Fungalysin metallopeptidase-domain-containing protein [Obelidium mucronatum]